MTSQIQLRRADKLERDKRQTMHWLHFVISILTGFLWCPVWLIRGLLNGYHNRAIDKRIDAIYSQVDADNITEERAK